MYKMLSLKNIQITCISICVALSASFTTLAVNAAENTKAQNIDVFSDPIDFTFSNSKLDQFGSLLWRGGVSLTSKSPVFGGFSAVELSADGKELLAVSDRGYWLKANIQYNNGKIRRLTDAQIAPILNAKGKKFSYWRADSEGLTKRNDSLSDVVISVEMEQAIYRFKFDDNQLDAKAKNWGALADADKLPRNRGIEGITSLPIGHNYRGWMLTTAEKKLNANGDHTAWLVKGKENLPLYIKRSDDYDITDVSYLPNGDIVILERHFSLLGGPKMRIRQICGKHIRPDATVDGKILIDAGWGYTVDNMEGIGVHKAPNGETILTIISDNNFYFLQRNLLMQFALADEKSTCQ